MAVKRLTLDGKSISKMFKGLEVSYTESQTKCKSDEYKLRYRMFSFCLVTVANETFFKMAAKRLTLEGKSIRTIFKGLEVSYTESQTKCKSDQYKRRYRVFCLVTVAKGRHFSRWRPNG